MANYVTDDAVCLRVTDFSETSQIVALLTRQHGLVPMIAKGSKRQTKKGTTGTFSGPLDLLTAGQVVFLPAKGAAELATLAAWELTDHRTTLRTHLPALEAAMLMTEITLGLLRPLDPHADLWEQFDVTLQLLPGPQRLRVIVAYAKSALTVAGFQPQLDACLVCGQPIVPEAEYRFIPLAGGVFCPDCPTPSAGGGKNNVRLVVSGKIIVALERLADPLQLRENPPERPADPAALKTALQILLAQIEATIDRPLRTRAVVDQLFR